MYLCQVPYHVLASLTEIYFLTKCFKILFLQKIRKLKNSYGQYVLKTSLRHFLMTASRSLEDQQMFDGILIYCSTRICNAVFMSINCNIYPAVLSIIFCGICWFILTAIGHILIEAAVFHPAREVVNILIIVNSVKLNWFINRS